MPISPRIVQTRLPMVGALRYGYSTPKGNGKQPMTLEIWRPTSPNRDVIVELAELYGGEPREWVDGKRREWEVFTKTNAIEVFVPRQRIDPYLEAWDAGVLRRRCDGETERLRAKPCQCLQGCRIPGRPEHDFESSLLARGKCPCGGVRICKPTTRFSVLIADIHAAGVWKVESRGWNAAAELPGMAEGIANAREPVPAVLRLRVEHGTRLTIKNGAEVIEPYKFVVPWLDFNGLFTPRQAFTGELSTAARAAIGAPERTAIDAGPTRASLTEEQVLDQAGHLQKTEQVATLRKMAEDSDVLTDPVRAALEAAEARISEGRARTAAVAPQRSRPAVTPATPSAPAKQPPKDVVVDAEIVDYVEVRRLWAEIVKAGAERGRDETYTTLRFEQRYGYHPGDEAKVRAVDFEAFLSWLRTAGQPAGDGQAG